MTHPLLDPSDLSRRGLLRHSIAGAAAGLLAGAGLARADAPTPPQVLGPFHPRPAGVDRRLLQAIDRDADLTFVDDRPGGTAFGRPLVISGRVEDERGLPIAGAEVEIWQACVSGRYNHRGDPNREWLDPYFQYWGKAVSDAQGEYAFRTVVPGAYKASQTWIRPPHVHFKVTRLGYRELVTQLYPRDVPFYYAGRFRAASLLRSLLQADLVLGEVPLAERGRVVVPAPRGLIAGEPDTHVATFDITLAALRPRATPADPDLTALLSA